MIVQPLKRIALAWVLPGAALLIATGCDRPQVTTYRVPKETPPAAKPVAADASAPRFNRPTQTIQWSALPKGWETAPNTRMSSAAFRINADGQSAEVTVTPLPPMAGREADLVNIYRQMAGLETIAEADAVAALKPAKVAGKDGKIFEITGKLPGADAEQKIVTALLNEPEASWFFKLSGAPAFVDAQKAGFADFVKGVQFVAASDAPPAAPVAPEAATPQFKWTVPDSWSAVAAGQMQVAKFTVPAAGSAKAEVSVSIFPSDTGGLASNVDRWRGQLGLGPATEAELKQLVTPLDPADSRATLVDMKNNGRQLIGAIVPRGGRWFFYKLLGDEAAVTPQKEAFVKFVKSEP